VCSQIHLAHTERIYMPKLQAPTIPLLIWFAKFHRIIKSNNFDQRGEQLRPHGVRDEGIASHQGGVY
jgi:hypothetical protein